jgi:hypothetical protein
MLCQEKSGNPGLLGAKVHNYKKITTLHFLLSWLPKTFFLGAGQQGDQMGL